MQHQFLEVIDRDEAERRFRTAIRLEKLGEELVPLDAGLGRILSRDVISPVDVPSFDRANVDGFAVHAADTYGAREELPRRLRLLPEIVATGAQPNSHIRPGQAITIATGGMIPRGADSVVMVENVDEQEDSILVRRAVTPGAYISFAGTDITRQETVLREGDLLTSRETGVLAAIGTTSIWVCRRPRVAVISTGDEIIAPGETMRPGLVFDSNARILADAIIELGGEPVCQGIVRDNEEDLRNQLATGLRDCDIVVLSGGTSKGAGDLSYRVVQELTDPGIVAHGVALKPGKPICLAASRGKPVVILPGFPTSAVFTFHEFVAPVIRHLGGQAPRSRNTVQARMAVRVNSEIGRTEYLLVGLVSMDLSEAGPHNENRQLIAYPMGKGSGSVTAFSRADGFVTIGRHDEIVEAGAFVSVELLGRNLRVADLVVIGSHCIGLDFLLSELQRRGWHTKFLAVGSTAGLEAARRGECDLAGIHLLDPVTGKYNLPFLSSDLDLIEGYGRLQGVVFRRGDERFQGRTAREVVALVKELPDCLMVNRNQGSGTRVLIDQLLAGAQPSGFPNQPRNHNAVASAVAQKRADWGVTIRSVAEKANLGFLPLANEQFDFVIPHNRLSRPAVVAFIELLQDPVVRSKLRELL